MSRIASRPKNFLAEATDALARADEVNAKNRRDDAIRAVLEEMIGGPVLSGRGLLAAMTGKAFAPDFERHLSAESYRDLSDRIAQLEKVRAEASRLLAMLREPQVDASGLAMGIEGGKGLDFWNLVALHGVVPSAQIALVSLDVSAAHAIRNAESERRAKFPKGKGRRRNPISYRIADDLARFYVEHLLERPTYGTNSGYPSTPYMKALEQIFEILDIRTPKGKLVSLRAPAEAACKSITEEEINRARGSNRALGSILNIGSTSG